MLGAGHGAGHGAASSQQALGEGTVDGGGVPSAVVVLHGRVRVQFEALATGEVAVGVEASGDVAVSGMGELGC